VIANKLREKNIVGNDNDVRVISIDLQEMAPIDGVHILQGDITREQTVKSILELFHGNMAELVVCDGAPDVTGFHDIDQYIQAQLIVSALNITTHLLKPNGTFVAKIFRGKDISLMYAQLKVFFKNVYCAKPKSSRNSSIESFVVCKGFSPPEGYKPQKLSLIESLHMLNLYGNEEEGKEETKEKDIMRKIVPFVACGDLSGYDADMNYSLQVEGEEEEKYEYHEPTQKPIKPPYQTYLEKIKKS